jgi:acyl-CoA synthetase (AMP-forming)/AMP-acid ligase II
MTYRELDARAETLARALGTRGVRAGVLVGVCMERSFEMIVALVGILKSGGAYVPLDPDYPAERLAFMLSDSRCTVVLTQQRLAPMLSTLSPGTRPMTPRRQSCSASTRNGIASSPRPRRGRLRRPWCRRPRLHDLHLRFDRAAQRCHEPASRHRELAALDAARVWTDGYRRRPAEDANELRSVSAGAVHAAAGGRAARGRRTGGAP